ncbi:chorismate mutase [Leifsonia sp. 2TAF2]|uniref:chorismate mutase n=1 Tax=Leifsonia sp. 2TAF2 TaxID=3233009 RepID=UPI003F95E298
MRAEIDALDGEIVRLIAQRQRWVVEAGALKQDRGAVSAPDRVAKDLSELIQARSERLPGADRPGAVIQR